MGVQEVSPRRKSEMIISYDHDQLINDAPPPGLLTISMDSSMTQSDKTMATCKSNLSYDDNVTMTPSIAFFLTANKQDLFNEGLSVANESVSLSPRLRNHNNTTNTNHSLQCISSASLDMSDTEESQTARGYSRGSSKFTTDSPS